MLNTNIRILFYFYPQHKSQVNFRWKGIIKADPIEMAYIYNKGIYST